MKLQALRLATLLKRDSNNLRTGSFRTPPVAASGCTNDKKQCWETVFKCKHKMETLRKVISVSQNIILISHSSDTIGKLEAIGKITLYIISQG